MALLTAGMTFARQSSARAAAGAVCYLVSDALEGEGTTEDGISTITWVGDGFDPDSEADVAAITLANGDPTADMEASAFNPWTQTHYAINAQPGAGTGALLGTLDPATGVFAPIGTGLGVEASQPTPIALADVDGLTIHPFDQSVWAVVRRRDTTGGAGLEDALIRIDPVTGTFIAGTFSGNDYVLLTLAGGTTAGYMDVDDISFDPTSGLLYAVANDEGSGSVTPNSSLVLIDPATGTMSPALNLGSEDVEGLAFHNDGTLWATVGQRVTAPIGISELLEIDLANSTVTTIGSLGGGNTATASNFSDIEGISCLTGVPNLITGTLFSDPNGSGGTFDAANGDIASSLGLTVNLYRDLNGDGLLDVSDLLIGTTTTDANGDYSFSVAANGTFLVELAGTTPDPATTPTTYAVDFGELVGQTDADNDFGYGSAGVYDLALTIAPTLGQPGTVAPGATVQYGVTVTNQGNIDAATFDVTVTYPASDWTLSAAAIAAGWVDNGNGSASRTVTPATPLSTTDTWADTIELIAPTTIVDGTYTVTAEISANDNGGADADSTTDVNPANDGTVTDDEIDGANGDEDDHDIADIIVQNPVVTPDQIDLALTKDLAAGQSATIAPGADVTYTLTVTNDGADDATSFEITDTFPTGWTLAAAGNTGWTDGGTSATYTANPSPALAGNGGTWTVDITLVTGQTTGSFNNSAEITADSGDDADSTPDNNNPAEDDQDLAGVTVEQTVIPVYDLALTTTLADGQNTTVNPGDTVTFKVTVTNQGDLDAASFTIYDELPTGFTLTAAAIAAGWVDGNDGTASLLVTPATPLASGEMWMEDLELVASTTPGTYTNAAEISNDDGDDADSVTDTNLGNDGIITNDEIDGANGDEDDHDIEEIVILDPITDVYDLALTTTLANGQSATVNPGDTVMFQVNVTNQGNTAASTITITDVLPQGFTLTAAAIADGWVDNNDGTATRVVTFVTPLAPGDTWIGDLSVDVPAGTTPGTYTNGAEISTDDGNDVDSAPDADLSNDGTVTNDEINGANGDQDDHDTEDIVVEAAAVQGFSIGNTVFEDTNNNGTQDAGEPGIAGVTVQLWEDTDNDGAFDTIVESTTTDTNGNYSFDESTPGDYVVAIPPAMFAAGAPLENWNSSAGTGAIGTDTDDDGIDPANPGEIVLTELFTVDANTGDRITIDFGFAAPAAQTFSLGNRVFEDTNSNGVRDGGEPAIDGVTVELWQDTSGDGIVDTRIATTVTANSGLYTFDDLAEGEYVVVVPAAMFTAGGPLAGFTSSPNVGDLDTNNDDDGIDPITAGGLVRTGFVTMDANSGDRFEVDFGFVPTNVGGNNGRVQSIGNVVFDDANDNGLRDAGEVGIAGVTVQLFEDTDGDGVGDTLVETTTTDADGAYSFDQLPNGSYVVVIPSAQFAAGGALDGLVSSQGVGQLTTDDDDDGIDPAQAGGDVLTGVIVLSDATNGFVGVDFGFFESDLIGESPDVDLEISKSLMGVMKTNSTVMWSLIVTNNGPDDEETAITVTDVLPFGLTAITAAGNGWDCEISGANTTVICNRYDGLVSGSALPAIIIETSVEAAVGTEVFNQARVDSENVETITNNNRAQDGGTVEKGGHIAFTGAYSTTLAILALSMISMGLAWSMMRRREDLEIGFAV